MNSRALILALTLLAAGQLAALLTTGRNWGRSDSAQTVSDRGATESHSAPQAVAASAGSEPNAAGLTPAPAQRPSPSVHWAALESTNYLTYIANLRAFGVPEPTVRDIIVAEVNKLYEPREAALKAQLADLATNRTALPLTPAARSERLEARRQLRQVQQEKHLLIKSLLGPGAALESTAADQGDSAQVLAAANVLSPDKRDAVLEIELNHRLGLEALQQDWAAALGQPGPRGSGAERLAAVRQLQAQRLSQLSQVLSPSELEEYQMRASGLGAELAESLALFQPTEEEFRQLFRIRTQAEQAQLAGGQAGPSAEDIEAQLKAALGPQRYAEYRRAQEPTYEELRRLADRYSLPQDKVDQVFEALTPLIQQAEQIEADDALEPGQQNQALNHLRAQADRLLVEHLGERAARAFRRYSELFSDLFSPTD